MYLVIHSITTCPNTMFTCWVTCQCDYNLGFTCNYSHSVMFGFFRCAEGHCFAGPAAKKYVFQSTCRIALENI